MKGKRGTEENSLRGRQHYSEDTADYDRIATTGELGQGKSEDHRRRVRRLRFLLKERGTQNSYQI
jgi:hypothetical protein